MSIKFTNPQDGERFSLNEQVTFQGISSNDIATIKLLAEGKWLLGESAVTSNSWSVRYKFNRLGQRQIIVKGFDAAAQELAQAEISINIQAPLITCDQRNELFTVGENSVWQISGQSAFFYKSEMQIDADGAPNAYHPKDIGIDFLDNAGEVGNWWALVTDTGESDGEPLIQQPGDPFPGFYISTTTLEDSNKEISDPFRYVDASKIPYVVLPGNSSVQTTGVQLGDYAAVFNGNNNKIAFAIYADVGNPDQLGEGSTALSQALGHNPFVGSKVKTGISNNILYVIFPGSRKPTNQWSSNESADDIAEAAKLHFDAWGGIARIQACFEELK